MANKREILGIIGFWLICLFGGVGVGTAAYKCLTPSTTHNEAKAPHPSKPSRTRKGSVAVEEAKPLEVTLVETTASGDIVAFGTYYNVVDIDEMYIHGALTALTLTGINYVHSVPITTNNEIRITTKSVRIYKNGHWE